MSPFQHLGQIDRFVLPKEDARALRFLMNHLFVPHNRREWIRSRVARGVFGTPDGSLWSPLGLSAAGAADLVREVLDWARSQVSRERGSGWSFILYRDGAPLAWTRLLLFLFHGRERVPVALVKLARQGLRSEWEALRALCSGLAPELAATVPLPAVYRWFEGIEALLMPSLPGRSMSYEMGPRPASARKVEHHLSNGATWLACFHLVTRDRSARFCAGEEVSRAEHELPVWFDRAQLEPLRTEKLEIPHSATHGAFQPRNLLVRGRGAGRRGSMTEISGVLDWERFSRSAPPFEDLFHFALAYTLDYPWSPFERKPPQEAFRRGFLSENAVSRGIRSALRSYCDLTGLPFEKLRPLFHLYLLDRSRGREASRPMPPGSLHRLLVEAERTVFDL